MKVNWNQSKQENKQHILEKNGKLIKRKKTVKPKLAILGKNNKIIKPLAKLIKKNERRFKWSLSGLKDNCYRSYSQEWGNKLYKCLTDILYTWNWFKKKKVNRNSLQIIKIIYTSK